jgi:AraC-like DNA-binding protein
VLRFCAQALASAALLRKYGIFAILLLLSSEAELGEKRLARRFRQDFDDFFRRITRFE